MRVSGPTTRMSSSPSSTIAVGVTFMPPPSDTPLPTDIITPPDSKVSPSWVIVYSIGLRVMSSRSIASV